jgi:hypothetical protein
MVRMGSPVRFRRGLQQADDQQTLVVFTFGAAWRGSEVVSLVSES